MVGMLHINNGFIRSPTRLGEVAPSWPKAGGSTTQVSTAVAALQQHHQPAPVPTLTSTMSLRELAISSLAFSSVCTPLLLSPWAA